MPLHHYLPASFLARFSFDGKEILVRNRYVFVGDKKTKKIFKAPVGKVGCIKNLYTLSDNSSDPNIVDQVWEEYEKKLPTAIDELINGTIEVSTWIRTLVPFVACMLVRGPDFVEKFRSRFDTLPFNIPKYAFSQDNANRARLIDLQRILTFVVTAKWTVISCEEPIITNDLGYIPFFNPINHDVGIAIPLDSGHLLVVIPYLDHHPILRWEGNRWLPIINYQQVSDMSWLNINRVGLVVSNVSNRFIFGGSEKSIEKYLKGTNPSPSSIDISELGFPGGKFARAHEFTWHRLVAAIHRPSSDRGDWDFPLNIEALLTGWHPIMMFATNLVEFPPALMKIGDMIWSKFYDPEIYYEYSEILQLKDSRKFKEVVQKATKVLKMKMPQVLRARILAIRGSVFDELGKNRQARKDYEKAIRLDRSNAVIHADFGYVLIKGNQLPKALEVLSEAIKFDSTLGIAYSNRAVVSWKMGKMKAAIEDFNSAIDFIPDGIEKAQVFQNRGRLRKILGLDAEANEDLFKANELFKKYADNNTSSEFHE